MNDLVILSSLLEGPKHGYEIKRVAGTVLGDAVLHNNQVYPSLHRFEGNGWVARKKVPGQRGQMRWMYRLTPKGRAEMVRCLIHYPDHLRADEEFYLRVGLFQILPVRVRQQILDTRERQLRAEAAHFRRIRSDLSPPAFLGGEVLRYLEGRAVAEIGWIRGLRRRLGADGRTTKKLPEARRARAAQRAGRRNP